MYTALEPAEHAVVLLLPMLLLLFDRVHQRQQSAVLTTLIEAPESMRPSRGIRSWHM
jgi:hypothetical protein